MPWTFGLFWLLAVLLRFARRVAFLFDSLENVEKVVFSSKLLDRKSHVVKTVRNCSQNSKNEGSEQRLQHFSLLPNNTLCVKTSKRIQTLDITQFLQNRTLNK